jgi:acyl transferase domain-containing protein/NADPH:quinone reductase-like Zn-dependent oxidoreductase
MKNDERGNDIALIGMAGRFPGARNVDEFWRLLTDGVDALREFCREQHIQARMPATVTANPRYLPLGYYLDGIEDFDADFFGFSAGEARILDPQHRLFFECVWEALESSGYISKTDRLQVGLYAGVSLSAYMQVNHYPSLNATERPTQYLQALIGTDKDYLSTQVSYKLNLRGPSMSVQTACSSSLVSLSLACQALLDYQCDVALAGGVTVRHVHRGRLGYVYEEGSILSRDARCRPFDAQASGTNFGNGAGVVVLRRLEDALDDRDPILAVIKEVAVNNDGGLKVGYTAPSLQGQAEVISMALAMAGVLPESISYIEAHGSGTPLGDPIEIAALTQAFRSCAGKKGSCAIGSVKSNVGHLESAAGAAGLIKTVLALQHRQIPPSLHYHTANPEIDFSSTPFYVNTSLAPWPRNGDTPRRAGVSSFGIGGTNAHAIVEEAPAVEPPHNACERPWHVLALSAQTEPALRELAERYAPFLDGGVDAASACYSSNTGRRHFEHRLAVSGRTAAELRAALECYLRGEECLGLVRGVASASPEPVAFLFAGGDSACEDIGKELLETLPTFRETLLRSREMLPGRARLAVQYAMAELWKSWGVEPAAVSGDGAEEYVAACASGAFNVKNGLKREALRVGAPPISSFEELRRQGIKLFLQVGPEFGPQQRAEDHATWLPGFCPGDADWPRVIESFSRLYVSGAAVCWEGFDRDYARQRITQPTYPFQRKRYWVDEPALRVSAEAAETAHPLLGRRIALAGTSEARFESRISSADPAFLADHRVFDATVLPAAAYVEIALAAAQEAWKGQPAAIEDFSIVKPLSLPDGCSITVQTVLTEEGGSHLFQIFSAESARVATENAWTLHASGMLIPEGRHAAAHRMSTEEVPAQFPREIPVEEMYAGFARCHLLYGPSFRTLCSIRISAENLHESLAEIRLPENVPDGAAFRLHPLLFDGCIQACAAAAGNRGETYLPVGLQRLELFRSPQRSLWCRTRLTSRPDADGEQRPVSVDFEFFDEAGGLGKVEGLLARRVSRETLRPSLAEGFENLFYQVAWQPHDRVQSVSADPGVWLIFADSSGVGEALANVLRARGHRAITVRPGGSFRRIDTDSFLIAPGNAEDLRALDLETGSEGCRAAIHLWSLDADAPHSEPGPALVLAQALLGVRRRQTPRLCFVTRGAQPAGQAPSEMGVATAWLWGFGRAIAVEAPQLRPLCIDLDSASALSEAEDLAEELLAAEDCDWVAMRHHVRYTARLLRHGDATPDGLLVSEEHFRLRIATPGVLENLWLAPHRCEPAAGEVAIDVKAAGLNFRDVLQAMGLLRFSVNGDSEIPFGFECSGTVAAVGTGVTSIQPGDEVLALAAGSIASRVSVRAEFVFPKPSRLSFEDAATLPVAFLTASYALDGLQPGESVLIHAAAGGVGQAAVQLARHAGARILTTASPGKWEFVKASGAEEVMNSRSVEFADETLARTAGRGVDVVLNSLNGVFIPKSLGVLAQGGRFVEIGKIGLWSADRVRELRPDVSYRVFELGEEVLRRPVELRRRMLDLLGDFESGALRPLPASVFLIRDAAHAFRHMAQGKHVGKVVLAVRRSEVGIRPDSTYLITGGLGALGLHAAEWMAQMGAGRLVLCGRRPGGPEQLRRVEELRRTGARVEIVTADVAEAREVERLVAAANSQQWPLRGVVHAAGVFADAALADQDAGRFERVMAPKRQGGMNLHRATLDLPLDFFICYSSSGSFMPAPGQANYAAANASLDALAHYRRSRGLTALTIDWGPWAAGMAASAGERARQHRSGLGICDITPQLGTQVLDHMIRRGAGAQVACLSIDWEQFRAHVRSGQSNEFFAALARRPTPEPRAAVLQEMQEAAASERRGLLESYVIEQVARALGVSAESVEPRQGLFDMGIDSLIAIDLRNRLQADLGVPLTQTLAFDYPTLDALVDHLSHELFASADAFAAAPEAPPETEEDLDTLLAELQGISDSEVQARFRQVAK